MHKGGRPCGKSAATMNWEREQEEKANPEKRQRRIQDDDYKKINFFGGHTRTTVSADNVSAVILDSATVLVHESLSDISDRLEDRLCLEQKRTKFVCLSVLLSPSG